MPDFDLGNVLGEDAPKIESIEKTSTFGLVDTYTITLEDGSNYNFTVTNGADANIADFYGDSTENTITLEYESTTDILDIVYPVGSIYLSVNSTDPATLFGGTWVQLEDKFLLGAGDTYTNGATGGEATHTLTEAELPNISGTYGIHGQEDGTNIYHVYGKANGTKVESKYRPLNTAVNNEYSYSDVGFNFGQNQAHNNMPPYLVVYMWKRTE